MRIVCWQTILMKYHTLFFSKIGEDVAKFVVCCSRDWRFKGKSKAIGSIFLSRASAKLENAPINILQTQDQTPLHPHTMGAPANTGI